MRSRQMSGCKYIDVSKTIITFFHISLHAACTKHVSLHVVLRPSLRRHAPLSLAMSSKSAPPPSSAQQAAAIEQILMAQAEMQVGLLYSAVPRRPSSIGAPSRREDASAILRLVLPCCSSSCAVHVAGGVRMEFQELHICGQRAIIERQGEALYFFGRGDVH